MTEKLLASCTKYLHTYLLHNDIHCGEDAMRLRGFEGDKEPTFCGFEVMTSVMSTEYE